MAGMTATVGSPIRPLQWRGSVDGHLELLDQTRLPTEVVRLACRDVETLWEAIRNLRVRGAPAIGCAAAYGVVLAFQPASRGSAADWLEAVERGCNRLAESRPTAVNLFWALDRMRRKAQSIRGTAAREAGEALMAEAHAIRDEDAAMCRAIGRNGAELIRDGMGVLTHCNAGALATSEYGTALALMYAAHERGRRFKVFADETRPLLQGARLTAWELQQAGIDVTLICDSMAAQVMREGRVQLVVVGADRIAANGDAANKIGTYGLAVIAKAHNVPMYVAAPRTTFDLATPAGAAIPIEQRAGDEISHGFGRQTGPHGIACYNPAFDVTPAELLAGIVTEHGIIRPVNRDMVGKMLSDKD
jgi:methylthioribose-1-phosphate isomerase